MGFRERAAITPVSQKDYDPATALADVISSAVEKIFGRDVIRGTDRARKLLFTEDG